MNGRSFNTMPAAHALLLAGMAGLPGPCSPASAATLVDQNAKVTHAYVLMQANMIDEATFFQKYAVAAEVEVVRHGGQALLGTHLRKEIEGQWDGNWTLALRFPSLKNIDEWYHSAGYQAVVPYRYQSTAWGRMVAFEGLPESSLDWRLDRRDGADVRLSFPATLDMTPQYVVTADVTWRQGPGSFALSAGMAPQPLSNTSLRVELASTSATRDAVLEVTPVLRDEAGNRWRLPRQTWRPSGDGGWQAFQWTIGQATSLIAERPDAQGGRPIQAVELELGRVRPGTAQAMQVRVRNLNISR